MPRARSIRLYSDNYFKSASRLDRIRMYMMEPDRFDLNDADHTYYMRLMNAYHLVFQEVQHSLAVKAIQQNVPGVSSMYLAYQLLNDINELFGPFLNKNKELRKAVMVDKFYEMAKVAEKRAWGKKTDDEGNEMEFADPDWMELAMKLYSKAAELEGLHLEESNMPDPAELIIPAIEVTSDPAAFLAAQASDEDEYEENDELGEEAEPDE